MVTVFIVLSSCSPGSFHESRHCWLGPRVCSYAAVVHNLSTCTICKMHCAISKIAHAQFANLWPNTNTNPNPEPNPNPSQNAQTHKLRSTLLSSVPTITNYYYDYDSTWMTMIIMMLTFTNDYGVWRWRLLYTRLQCLVCRKVFVPATCRPVCTADILTLHWLLCNLALRTISWSSIVTTPVNDPNICDIS